MPHGEPAEGPQASPGLRSDLLHESLRQPSAALSAWGRLLAALDLPELHAQALALAHGPVRYPAQQADQARRRGHRNGRPHSNRPGLGVSGRGHPHRRLGTPRPVRYLIDRAVCPHSATRPRNPKPTDPHTTEAGPLVDPKNSKVNDREKFT